MSVGIMSRAAEARGHERERQRMSSEFAHLLTLDVPQKLELIGALWQSIEDTPQQLPVSDELIAELDRRKASAEQSPQSLIPWERIQQRLGLSRGE